MAKKSTRKKAAVKPSKAAYVWALTRISLGFTFLWAFFDKLWGLGFATCRGEDGSVEYLCSRAWVEGGSPTTGFLKFGTEGSPFESVFQSMAGNAFWDWLFMIGLLGIGIALTFGIGMMIAGYTGALLMMLMYLAAFQPENNPIVDDHLVYALVIFGLYKANDDQVWGLGSWWAKQDLVKRYPFLR